MPSITIKNIPAPIYNSVKQRARLHHRSINGEIISILEEVSAHPVLSPREILQKARELRGFTAGTKVSAEDIQRAKEFGRR